MEIRYPKISVPAGTTYLAGLHVACLHDQNKSGFFWRAGFFSANERFFVYFLNCSDWLDKSRPSKKVTFVLIM